MRCWRDYTEHVVTEPPAAPSRSTEPPRQTPARPSRFAGPAHFGRGERVAAGVTFIAIAGALVALAVVGAVAPDRLAWSEDGPTTCPFKLVTGLRCPLCGMTRATLRLARHDLHGALHLHPLAPLVLALVFGVILAWLAYPALGRRVPRRLQARPSWILVGAAVWIINLAFGTG